MAQILYDGDYFIDIYGNRIEIRVYQGVVTVQSIYPVMRHISNIDDLIEPIDNLNIDNIPQQANNEVDGGLILSLKTTFITVTKHMMKKEYKQKIMSVILNQTLRLLIRVFFFSKEYDILIYALGNTGTQTPDATTNDTPPGNPLLALGFIFGKKIKKNINCVGKFKDAPIQTRDTHDERLLFGCNPELFSKKKFEKLIPNGTANTEYHCFCFKESKIREVVRLLGMRIEKYERHFGKTKHQWYLCWGCRRLTQTRRWNRHHERCRYFMNHQ